MNPWKLHHFIAMIAIIATVSVAGYYLGVILANPPLTENEYQKYISSLVEKKVGKKPFSVTAIAGEDTDFGNLTGSVTETGGKKYFLVKMDQKTDLQTSAIEGVQEDILHVGDIYNVIVDEKGNVEVLKVRY